ncbi:MAG: bifunctional diaminohydroxyphosphoribosylaminopyrimidine deaminase/5-amino-6-(5-phosphoribosylamino)uracil reductase RibD [Bacteroidales bacterium]|jgi:diaminohydroxyphosphoribosylaminopyrimidine deaminase/5-amino-6-(5-phosphoribosylamino)uracil reductase|nr:bifunctional diaminohydroxyphosphoribosylaminopyrimidine deaminase/5-amino-6-(5-phosphoribosylamino)uracil reductase RibD [Bacteroidales bacterium]
MTNPDDLFYMRRCLDLAVRAEGNTSPNPLVGSVIVHDGRITGEGYHLRAGTPHAEVHAINSVADKTLLPSSTLYASLEPCSHQGRTPPCTDLIIKSGIKRVVIGTMDTSLKVAGRGIEKMSAAGIEVITGIAEDECRRVNRRFFTWHEKHRPYVILKWARSADGYIDFNRSPGDAAEPHWITGMTERVLVHRWRAAEDAILAGGGTVRADNPSLDVRLWKGKNPVKIIISRSGALDRASKIFNGTADVILFTRNRDVTFQNTRVIYLKEDQDFIGEVLANLHQMGIQSLFVEGGGFIIKSFITSGLWDEAWRFTGKKKFGGGVADPFTSFNACRSYHFEHSILEKAQKF